jgi:hypothetical protein
VSRPPGAPSGGAPPSSAILPDGSHLELVPLAREIARRHRLEFPDEADRYGQRGLEWCVYDNQWLLSWAIMAAAGWGDFHAQLAWLAGILESRGYPVARLARDLEIAAEVTTGTLSAEPDPLRVVLLSGAEATRAHRPTSS